MADKMIVIVGDVPGDVSGNETYIMAKLFASAIFRKLSEGISAVGRILEFFIEQAACPFSQSA